MIAPTDTSWKITSQLMLPNASNMFPPTCLKKLNNPASFLESNHIWGKTTNFNLLNKIIRIKGVGSREWGVGNRNLYIKEGSRE